MVSSRVLILFVMLSTPPILMIPARTFGLGIISSCANLEDQIAPQLYAVPEAKGPERPDITAVVNSSVFHNGVTKMYQQFVKLRHPDQDSELRLAQAKTDLALFWSGAFRRHGGCISQNYILVPVIVGYRRGMNREDYRISYKLWFYDHGKFGLDQAPADLLIDPAEYSATIGDPKGYTLAELQARYVQLKSTVTDLEEIFFYSSWGLVGTALLKFRPVQISLAIGIRVMGNAMARSITSALIVGLGYYAINFERVDKMPLRELEDISGAAEAARRQAIRVQ